MAAPKPENPYVNPWTDKAIERLTKIWGEGKSASEAAEILNNEFGLSLTRNSTIGKIKRLGLIRPEFMNRSNATKSAIAAQALSRLARKERMAAIEPDKNAVRKIVSSRNKPQPHQMLKFGEPRSAKKRAGKAIKPSVALEQVDPVEILDLKPSHCRWPIDRDVPGAWSCGAPKDGARPYCGWHSAKAFVAEKAA